MNIRRPVLSRRGLCVVALVLWSACSVSEGRSGQTRNRGEVARPAETARARQPTTEDVEAAGDPRVPGVERVDAALVERLAQAILARGPGYEPRTHHREDDGAATYTNRLALETSPYLLQHAHNPVNWYPWGDAAFERARVEGRPVLLSVGYSTCHWCHVMERESFEDVDIATFINENFIAIKVDREERPDVDEIYMRAVQLMTGRGGWPMTVVMTPARQPFFGGTYFPPRDGVRGARVGFLTILRDLSRRYSENRGALVQQATALSNRIRAMSSPQRPGGVPGAQVAHRLARALVSQYDPTWGGYGRAPKFPQPSRLMFMLRYIRRTRDAQALESVLGTLDGMAEGGIYDHVGGGFHRYSTDERWLVPHFEKMLYDNAQLARVYLEAFQLTGEARYATVADEVLSYVAREMTAESGAFYSATDADSPDGHGGIEEGLFFTWTPRELRAVLGVGRSRLVEQVYGVTPGGNFEGRSILHLPQSLAEAARAQRMPEATLREQLGGARRALYDARARRTPPLRDDKILTAWNGLMISAFARGAEVLGNTAYRQRAERAASFILENLRRRRGGRLLRSHMDGRARHNAYLDDYAMFIAGLLDLYEVSGEARWMRAAIELQGLLDAHYLDTERGGYFMTSSDHEALLTRDKPAQDGAVPSGNSVAVMNLLRLHEFTGGAQWRTRAEEAFQAFSVSLSNRPLSAPRMMAALDYYLDKPYEVVIVYPDGGAPPADLLLRLRGTYMPNRMLAVVSESEARAQSEFMPLLREKVAMGGEATAYVCEQGVCQRPTRDPAVFAEQIRRVHPYDVNSAVRAPRAPRTP